MPQYSYKIFPLGVGALTIEFGSSISVKVNRQAVNLGRHIEEKPFPGLIETVPAYASVTIFFDVVTVKKHFPTFETAFAAVKNIIERQYQTLSANDFDESRRIDIAVDFSVPHAPDLESIAARHKIEPQNVIEIFTARTYRVFMLGFLPGFSYMGEVDERIATPRRETPRLIVPKGSVGIAGKQTGIYPFDSPGGWQIIGRTDFELFAPESDQPCSLRAGDLVKFHAIAT